MNDLNFIGVNSQIALQKGNNMRHQSLQELSPKAYNINQIVILLLQKSCTISFLCKNFKIKESTLKKYFTEIRKIATDRNEKRFYNLKIIKNKVYLESNMWDKKANKKAVKELHKNKYYDDAINQRFKHEEPAMSGGRKKLEDNGSPVDTRTAEKENYIKQRISVTVDPENKVIKLGTRLKFTEIPIGHFFIGNYNIFKSVKSKDVMAHTMAPEYPVMVCYDVLDESKAGFKKGQITEDYFQQDFTYLCDKQETVDEILKKYKEMK